MQTNSFGQLGSVRYGKGLTKDLITIQRSKRLALDAASPVFRNLLVRLVLRLFGHM